MGFLFIGIRLISYKTRELFHLCFKEISKLIESKKMQPFFLFLLIIRRYLIRICLVKEQSSPLIIS
jgi:hypothetical protein